MINEQDVYKCTLLELVDQNEIDSRAALIWCLNALSEDSVKDILGCNDLLNKGVNNEKTIS